MPRRTKRYYLTGLVLSALIHISVVGALLFSPKPRAPLMEGGGRVEGVLVDLTRYSRPASRAPADPMDAIAGRTELQSSPAMLSQADSRPPPEPGGVRRLGDLAALFEAAEKAPSTAQPGDDLATQIGRCFSRSGSGVPIVLQVTVSRDGGVVAQPMVIRPPMATYPAERQALEQSALAAVAACAPYRVSLGERDRQSSQVTLR